MAGVGGLALYGALKPSEKEVIIINQGEQKAGESSSTAAAPAVAETSSASPPASASASTPLAPLPVAPVPVAPVAVAPVAQPVPLAPVASVPVTAPIDNGTSVVPDATTVMNSPMQSTSTDGTPLAPFPVTNIVTMAPPDVPPYSGQTIHYDQVPLAPFPSSQQPPICAPGQNPYDPLAKCTPLTVAPMYVTPSTIDGSGSVQSDVSAAPNANTSQNLQAQSALKSSAVSCSIFAFKILMIPMLTLLMV